MRRVLTSLVVAAGVVAVGLFAVPPDPVEAAGRGGTYVYVHDPAFGPTAHRIFGFEMDRRGALTPLPGSPYSTTQSFDFNRGGGLPSITYSRKRKMLVSVGDSFVTTWRVNRDGSLDLLSEVDTGDPQVTISVAAVDRGRDTFVYATSTSNAGIYSYSLDKQGGLTALADSPRTDLANPFLRATTRRDVLLTSSAGLHTMSVERDGTLTDDSASPSIPGPDAHGGLLGFDSKPRLAVYGSGGTLRAVQYDRRSGEVVATDAEGAATDLVNTDYGVTLSRRRVGFVVAKTTTAESTTQAFTIDRRSGGIEFLGQPQDIGLARPRARTLAKGDKILVAAASLVEKQIATYRIDRRTGVLTEIDREDLPEVNNSTAVIVVQR